MKNIRNITNTNPPLPGEIAEGQMAIGMLDGRIFTKDHLGDVIGIGGDAYAHASFSDPRYYGAKFDGVTDDTSAIQEAVNNNHTVYFPPLPCLSGEIFLPETNCHIIGEPGNKIKIKDGSRCFLRLAKADKSDDYFEGKNISVIGLNISCQNNQSAIDFRYGIYNCIVQKNTITGSVGKAIKIDNCWSIKIKENTIKSGEYNLWVGGGNNVIVTGNRFMFASKNGMKATLSDLSGETNRGMVIDANIFEYSQNSALLIDAAILVDITCNYFEANNKEYSELFAYIDIIDVGNEVRMVNIVENVIKEPHTSSLSYAIKADKAIHINIKGNNFEHFTNNFLNLDDVWTCNFLDNGLLGFSNASIKVGASTTLHTGGEECFLNKNLDYVARGTSPKVGAGYVSADNIKINTSGATVENEIIFLERGAFSHSPRNALKLHCTAADDNWGAFFLSPLPSGLSNTWVTISAWMKADQAMTNIQLSLEVKTNSTTNKIYAGSNRVSVSTEWALFFVSFRVYNESEIVDETGNMNLLIIHKENSDGVLNIAKPSVEIGTQIPSSKSEKSLGTDRYIEAIEVNTTNGDIHCCVAPKALANRTISSSKGTVVSTGKNSFKLSHDTEESAVIIMDNQW